ncbi:acyl-CoA dehydrogenase family protein [Nocardioides sp. R-C-SC26]|uniref:acyl-CoA dehydrogenase family protein n=1 Tax=Nocardioides sp. R-C-SC26 TaxID=2870414 RepID=UPI001E5BA7C7|nr:acyl-CoA dehydrogenase family protein [Nocardioides sp. R-C-SC26]
MDFTYDDEQGALREAVRGLVARTYGEYENRRRTVASDPGYDERLWGQLAEMGLLGLPFGEDDGGSGATWVEAAIVLQELGRVLAPEPYLTAVVQAGGLVADVGTAEQRAELLGGLSSGERLLSFAHASRRWSPSASGVTASQDGDTWTLQGRIDAVPQGANADVLIVSAETPAGTGLFVVPGDAVERSGHATYDGGRSARVVLGGVAATPLGDAGADQTSAIAAALDRTIVLGANEALGIIEQQLVDTTAYLKSRKQFGVTLNNFQALTFRAADMYTSVELTHSLVAWATMVAASVAAGERDSEQLSDAAARVAVQLGTAGRHVGQEAIQLHGGIAMTAEYRVGAGTSRLTYLEHLAGDRGHHLNELAAVVADHGALDPLAASVLGSAPVTAEVGS